MSTVELRTRYQENIEVLKKLRSMLNEGNVTNKLLIKESIDKVESEQNSISKRLRVSTYKNMSKKVSSQLCNTIKKETLNINKDNDIVYDKANVVISDIKEEEETPLKVINITGEEEKKNDDITEVLKKEKIPAKELEDSKIIFDGKYKLRYDDGKKTYEKELNETLLDLNLDYPESTNNYNITRLLKDFDEENDTHVSDKYPLNIDIVYNIDESKKSIGSKLTSKIKKLAKREQKNNDRVFIKSRLKTKVKRALMTAVLLGTGLMSIISLDKHSAKKFDTNQTTVVDDAGVTDAIYEEITDAKIKETTETAKNEEIVTEVKEEMVKEEPKVEDKKEEVKEEVEDVEEKQSIKIGDILTLEDTGLYTASTDENAAGNTSHLGEARYKVTVFSVIDDNKVMELIYDDSMDLDALEEICKQKYGDDVQISVNLDQLDNDNNTVTKKVGWSKAEDLESKGKVLSLEP